MTSTGLMYGVSIAAVVLLYVYYTGDYSGECKLHEFFISINLVNFALLILNSVLTISDYQDRDFLRINLDCLVRVKLGETELFYLFFGY